MDELDFPDVNPTLPALLNLLLAGCAGYFYLGQRTKGVVFGVAWVVTFCTGVGPVVVGLVAAYDAWLLGLKLQSGQSVGRTESGLEALDHVFRRSR